MTEIKDMGPFADMDPALVRAISQYGTPPYRETITVTVRDIGYHRFDKLPTDIPGWLEWLADARDETPAEYRDQLNCVLQWETGYYDSGDRASLNVWYERPETDKEMRDRVGRGVAYVQQGQAKERAAYEALKRKFEPR